MRNLLPARVTIAALIAALCLPTGADAQELAQVYEFTPKAGKATALDSALRQHNHWREENGDPWEWDVYQVVQGENYGTFIVRSAGHSWSDFDDYDQGFARNARAHFSATVASLMKETKAYIEQVDTAQTYAQEGDYSLYELITYKIKPGEDEAWLSAVQAVRDAYAQENRSEYFVTVDIVTGAGSSHRRLYLLHENYADFRDERRSSEEVAAAVYGEEKANKIWGQFTNSYSSVYRMVLRSRPDLAVEASSAGGGQ